MNNGKPKPVTIGVCDFCLDEYDKGKAPKQPLFRVGHYRGGDLMCGGCASERAGDIAQMNYEGRFDE